MYILRIKLLILCLNCLWYIFLKIYELIVLFLHENTQNWSLFLVYKKLYNSIISNDHKNSIYCRSRLTRRHFLNLTYLLFTNKHSLQHYTYEKFYCFLTEKLIDLRYCHKLCVRRNCKFKQSLFYFALCVFTKIGFRNFCFITFFVFLN